MNSLVRKEVRSILPAWLMAMALAILPVWIIWPGSPGDMRWDLGLLVFAPFGLGVLVLSLTPFGQELNWGTFSVLLSQPVSRKRVWSAKVITLGMALGFVFLALCISNHIRVDSVMESLKHTAWRNAFDRPGNQNQVFLRFIAETRSSATQDTLLIGGLAVLAGFAGGLWTTLLFRQVTAAFWVTLLVPSGMSLLAVSVLRNLPDAVAHILLALILGTYCVVGYFWAKKFFLCVQDTQWTGGIVALPNWGEIAFGRASQEGQRTRKPFWALARKEFQGQQVNVLLAGGLLLVHLATIAIRRWCTDYLATHHSMAMTLEMIPLLWLVMPLLVGSVAVAEERKLGTFQSSLCLPFSRRLQFFIRLGVAVALGAAFGAVLPLLIEFLAGPHSMMGLPSGLYFSGADRPVLFLQISGSLGLTLLSFYGSTLTRNALQGLGAALLAAVLACLVIFAAQHAEFDEFILWRGRLIALVGWPVMVCVMLVLAYRNHSDLQPDSNAWARNGLSQLLGLLCVAGVTTMIYHRVWEAWIPEEPLHSFGFNFLNVGGGKRPIMTNPATARPEAGGYLGVTIQDLTPALADEFRLSQANGPLIASVAPNSPAEAAGFMATDQVLSFNGKGVKNASQLESLVAETKSDSRVSIEIIRSGFHLNLKPTIGQMPDAHQIAFQLRVPKIEASSFQRAVVLPDGRLWLQRRHAGLTSRLPEMGLNPGMVTWYNTGPSHTGFVSGSNWRDVAVSGQGGCFGIQADGTLWDLSTIELGGWSPKPVGSNHDWAAISAGLEHFCALKSDGTLWQWNWSQAPLIVEPVQVGGDNDWVAVCDSWTMTAAIKADGTVWRWDRNPKSHGRLRRWLTGACPAPVSLSLGSGAIACVCADGTLWIGGALDNPLYERLLGSHLSRHSGELVQWGNDSDWRQIRFVGWGKVAGVKADGTLWEWDSRQVWGSAGRWPMQPVQPSHYADWLSVSGEDNTTFLALARDGNLCLWGHPDDYSFGDWVGLPDSRRLLMASRIKARRVADLSK